MMFYALIATTLYAAATAQALPGSGGDVTLRIAAFNIEDVRTQDISNPSQPRLRKIAEIIQRIRPNVILISEMAYDMPAGDAETNASAAPRGGLNAQRFADVFLAVPQGDGLAPLKFRAFMPPTNTGMSSGFDLDNDGKAVASYPAPSGSTSPDGRAPAQTPEGRAYGNDCWGFGTFPGQYGFALLVDERLEIDAGGIRTFRLLPWDYMPGAFIPTMPAGDADSAPPGNSTLNAPSKPASWYDDEERKHFRLSSKSHVDVPVKLPNGATVHFLCSHPTPPAFDGPEMRNKKRNHDEIRFWADYITGDAYIVDDANAAGGLRPGEPFVVLGDLNADPDEGSAFKNPIKTLLEGAAKLPVHPAPQADTHVHGLDDDDTCAFGLRLDYILPSTGIEVLRSGVWRGNYEITPKRRNDAGQGTTSAPRTPALDSFDAYPSDHFPVWADVRIAPPPAARGGTPAGLSPTRVRVGSDPAEAGR